MTGRDYHVTMITRSSGGSSGGEVGLAEFKARLSAYLRRVRRGETLTLLHRDTPIARVLPCDQAPAALPSRPPTRRLQDVELPRGRGKTDGVAALLEERQADR